MRGQIPSDLLDDAAKVRKKSYYSKHFGKNSISHFTNVSSYEMTFITLQSRHTCLGQLLIRGHVRICLEIYMVYAEVMRLTAWKQNYLFSMFADIKLSYLHIFFNVFRSSLSFYWRKRLFGLKKVSIFASPRHSKIGLTQKKYQRWWKSSYMF